MGLWWSVFLGIAQNKNVSTCNRLFLRALRAIIQFLRHLVQPVFFFFLDGITGIVSHQKRGSHTGPHRIGTDGSVGHEINASVDVEMVWVPLVKVYWGPSHMVLLSVYYTLSRDSDCYHELGLIYFLMMSTLMVASRHNSMNFLGFQNLQCAKWGVITAPEGILNRISLSWLLISRILFAIC